MFCVEPASDTHKERASDKITIILNKSENQMSGTNTTAKRDKIICGNCFIFKNIYVIIVFVFTVVYCITMWSTYAYTGALVQQNGFTQQQASYIVAITGVTDILGNIMS